MTGPGPLRVPGPDGALVVVTPATRRALADALTPAPRRPWRPRWPCWARGPWHPGCPCRWTP